MEAEDRTVEARMAGIAQLAHGVAGRAELLAARIGRQQITTRVAKGSLLREYRGVYRVGHRAPSIEARYLAAVRACGTHAALSGLAAAYLFELVDGPAPPPEVTAPTERKVRGVITHRSRRRPIQAVTWRGVRVTSVPRTVADIARVLPAAELARAWHEAATRHRATPAQVEAVLARFPNAPGAGRLRAVLRGDERVTLSRLESRFLERLREADLPLPETNVCAGERRVDCRWPEHKLTAELNSYRFHNSRYSWEGDYERARQAYARGDQFRQYTWRDVFEDPLRMMLELRDLLR